MRTKTPNAKRIADQIAEMVTRGGDVSAYFTKKFTAARAGMLRGLDARAARLNISSQLHAKRVAKPRSRKKAG